MSFLQSLFSLFRKGATNDAPSSSRDKKISLADLQEFSPEWIVIGLGNPGAKYAETRHNIGYWPIDRLVEKYGAEWLPVVGEKAKVATIRVEETPVLLVRSTTFMNNSGEAVGPLASALNVPAERVIVCHDELDIAKGQVRIKDKGGEGGHNGLRSMTAELGTQAYVRVRMGIGRPPKGTSVIDFVLAPFEDSDFDSDSGWIENTLGDSVDAVTLIVNNGTDIARNDIHTRKRT
ncbi:aminoacyl-tRNA hydrolase [uncultured Corynebacterium sp.]|uniref:aminoacyl-tRNA hydrolase n=1 Tax=uncultured Corynebacterium sp. TaxID=159447 RepID=UPI0025D97372|nr:aminoacyl-tRNA hydrolase [uncultured Corynebacterium sp.]